MFTTGVFKKTITGLALAASLGTATVASVEPAEAGWHHSEWRHSGWHHGWRQPVYHHGWAGPRFYHHRWGGPRFYHPGWGYRPIGVYHAHRPCLRRVFGPRGSHLVRVC